MTTSLTIGGLGHRDAALKSVSASCRLVAGNRRRRAWHEFRIQVLSAVCEAFNNIVLHGYQGRDDGPIEVKIRTRPDHIAVELRDWGASFDPNAVPEPDFESLPESGFGMFIIRAFMNVRYRPGSPNVLTLSKSLKPTVKGPA